MKPSGYPLPWCDRLDEPYHAVNLRLIFNRDGWREWQADKLMREIIPAIDKILEEAA